jgi:hypothetical protein
MPDRNTQFAGFAALVVEDLRLHGGFPMRPVNRSEVRPLIERIIARRAYDLVIHVMSHLTELEPHRIILTDEEQQAFLIETLDAMPDLTHWPDE